MKISNVIFIQMLIMIMFSNCQKQTNTDQTKENLIINSTPEKKEVLAAILRFHDGMREKNGELAVSAWIDSAAGYTISVDTLGKSTKRIDDPVDLESLQRIKKWLNETKDYLDEEIFNVEVKIDGDLAMAWVPYDFYRNKKFSHSGTNAFTLMKFDTIWKIVSVADTRYYGKKSLIRK